MSVQTNESNSANANHRQARINAALDEALRKIGQKIERLVTDEAEDILFRFFADGLPPDKLSAVRATIDAFRVDCEANTRNVVKRWRRRLDFMGLYDGYQQRHPGDRT